MSDSNEQVRELYHATRTLLSHLKRQGFDTKNYNNMGINEIHIRLSSNQLDMTLNKESGEKAYVKYHMGKTLRPANITEYVDSLFNVENILGKDDALLIIAKSDPNDTLMRTMQTLWDQKGYYLNIFSMERLQFNILEHSYVPPHSVLSKKEEKDMRAKYNVGDSEIPELSRFDPVAQAIGIRPGQICKIMRPSRTAISAPYFRICTGKA
jgi:DNA-directed RNA polymerase subunit H (RpoH/RPB5)